MFSSVLDTVMSFVWGSFLNVHTYVGVFLGAVFAPLWVKIWNYLAAFIVKKDPGAAPIIADVTNVANEVVAVVTPVANEVNAIVTPAVLPAGPGPAKAKK